MAAGQSGRKKIIAVIPARGGSKRIPLKNIIPFEGKPLIAWTIEAAQKSRLFSRIVVSTDSEEIAEISRKWGAEVPFLRDQFADDNSGVSSGTIRTLEQLEELDEVYDTVVQLFAVCPLRTADDIKSAYSYFLKKQHSFLISCFKYVGMNPWWAVTRDNKSRPSWIFSDVMKRSQDLPELYSPTGAIWIADISKLKKEGTFYGNDHIFWEMNWMRAIDIDVFDDLKLAKLYRSFKE